MKVSTTLAVLAAAGAALAGPLDHHQHKRLHKHRRRHQYAPYSVANSTVPSAGALLATGSGSGNRTSCTGTGTTSVLATNGITTSALVETTSLETKTITKTVTFTDYSGSSPKAYTTTIVDYEFVEVIIKYVTVYVTRHYPGPTPAAAGTYINPANSGDVQGVSPAGSINDSSAGHTSGNDNDGDNDDDDGSDDSDDSGDGSDAPSGYNSATAAPTTSAARYSNSTNAYQPNMQANLGAKKKTPPKKKTTKRVVHKTTQKKVVTSSKPATLDKVKTTSKTPVKSSSQITTSSSKKANATTSTANGVAPPGPTGTGTVSGCTKWYVAQSGDYCYKIAQDNNIDVNVFMSWNPSVNPPNCSNLQIGLAYCIASNAAVASSTTAAVASSSSSTTAVASSATTATLAPYATQSISSKTSAAAASATTGGAVAPPGPTGTGTVSGCTGWYVAVSGDYCYKIAQDYSIDVNVFMNWNPSVNPPNCNNLQVGKAYCVSTSGNFTQPSTTSAAPASSTAAGAQPTSTSQSSYITYSGNGTVAAGWPSMDQWMSFDDMWTANLPILQTSCGNNGWGANNSPQEIADLKDAIQQVSAECSPVIDPRFIFAIVLQESNGCTRAPTTSWGHANPGLMQTNQGTGTCNNNGVVQTPCPKTEIVQMIRDGTLGTTAGDGLKQCLAQATTPGVATYYGAARIYNGGLNGYHANDLGTGCCTLCYSSDVANRLRGWHSGVSGCHLGLGS